VVAIVKEGRLVDQAAAGEIVKVVTNQTPFYGESGGQIGDTGLMRAGETTLDVTDTRKYLGDLIVHEAVVKAGALALGAPVELIVDETRRGRLRRAHSATHLLHAALRRHLGPHVAQKGSLVAPDRLRFDFSHPKPMSPAEIAAVEAEVNEHLRRNEAVTIRLMDRDAAIEAGAMALFGEKYGDEVRVVSMGRGDDGRTYSVELCGGTHVARTGDIALFRIVQEAAVAAGVRRIEALVGEAAYEESVREHQRMLELAVLLKTSPEEITGRIETLVEERRRLERELSETRRKLVTGEGAGAATVKTVGEVRFAGRVLEGVPARELRGTADALKKELGSGVVALVGVNDGKAAVVVSVTDDLAGRYDAVRLLRAGVEAVGGSGGGGRADFAQGGGPDGGRAGEALRAIESVLAA
jgi:alanyl-tRNA synthetase